MARGTVFKTNFTSGVLDPKLKSRADLAHYQNGLEYGVNILILPHGGTRRRPGLRHVHQLPAAVAGNCMAAAFRFNAADQQYLLVFADQRIYFYKNKALLTNINGTGFDYLVSPWPIAVARDLRWMQSGDTMIIVQEDYEPRRLTRGATDTTWTISTITFDFIPQIDYNDALSPAATSEEQDVTFTGFSVGNTFKLDLEGVLTESITYDTVTASLEQRISKAVGSLYNTRTGEVTCVFQAGTTYRVQFNGGAARNYARMTGFATSGTGTVGVAPVADGVARTEDAWSATRGYPRTVTYYENRLIFGGTKSKVQTVLMSASNDPYNFDIGQGLADDAIQKTLDVDQVDSITAVVAGRHLQVFTEGGDFFVPDFPITPENSNFRLQSTTGSSTIDPVQAEGATLFLSPRGTGLHQFVYQDVEAAYVATSVSRLAGHLLVNPVDMTMQHANADDDTNYVYAVNENGSAAVLCILRSEEVAGWSEWVTEGQFVGAASLDEDVYFVVKRLDSAGVEQWHVEVLDEDYYTDSAVLAATVGALTVTNVTLASAGLGYYYRDVEVSAAHGLSIGDPAYISDVVASGVYDVNGYWTVLDVVSATVFRIKSAYGTSGSYVSGGTVIAGSGTAVAGLAHLNGIDCRVRADGAVLANATPAGGFITLPFASQLAEVGRNFNTRARLMPPLLDLGGASQMRRSRISKVRVNVKSTQGVLVNGYPMPERYLDVDPLDTAPAALTGEFEVTLAGWGVLQAVEFTQADPLPMTLLAAEYDVEMH